jgi:hypothetical protein
LDISFNINGLQEGKRYVIEFSVNGEGTTNIVGGPPVQGLPPTQETKPEKKEHDMPSIEDIEKDNQLELPSLEPDNAPTPKRKIKVERSWEGNLNE